MIPPSKNPSLLISLELNDRNACAKSERSRATKYLGWVVLSRDSWVNEWMNDTYTTFLIKWIKKACGVLISEVLSIESDDEVFFQDQLDLYLRRHFDTLSS